MTEAQRWEIRRHLYQVKLWTLMRDKAEAIKLIDQEIDKAIEKIEKLKPEENHERRQSD